MRDRTKQLLVINTGEKKQSGSGSQTIINQYSSYAGGSGVDLRDYLLKRIWDTAWELRTTEEGESYIFCKLPFISQHGVTLYADGGNIDLPSLYAGIPVDGTTITKNEDGKLMLNPNLELGGLDEEALQKYLDDYNYAKLSDVDNRINDLVNGAPAAYDTLKEIADVLQGNVNSIGDIITTLGTKADKTELAKYIPIAGDTEVTGIKNFLNGLKVGGLPISKYEGYDDVIYIDANVVLRGGLTQYAVDPVTIPSIIDSLPIAGYEAKGVASFSSEFFVIDANGKVSIIPDSVGLNEEELEAWLANSDYATKTYVGGQLESYALQSALTATNNTLATKWTQDDTKIANWDAAYSWGNHASAGYFLASNFTKTNIAAKLGISDWALAATKPSYTTKEVTEDTNLYFTNQRAIDALTETLKAYVTLKGTQTIEGEKNFTGGLKVNGSSIVYDSENGYWLLQGNLLITGGLTQYVDDGSVDLPNLYDGLPIDRDTIYWEETTNGKVLKAKVAEGGITSITSQMVVDALGFTPYDASNPNGYITSSALSGYQPKITSSAKLAASLVSGLATVATSGSYNDLSNKPTIPTSLKNPYALSWSGYSSGSYDGSAAKSITIPSNTNQLTNGAGFITIGSTVKAGAAETTDTLANWCKANQSYVGSIALSGTWYNLISVRHRNGASDGNLYGMLLYSSLTGDDNLIWRQHINNAWGTAKVLLDSSNYSSYALPLSGGTLAGTLRVNNIESSDSNGLLSYLPSNWTGVNNTQWGIGTIANQGVIRSNNTSLLHYRHGSDAYTIWDSGNDGSGSGLDADLLDGLDSTMFFIKRNDNYNGNNIALSSVNATPNSSNIWNHPNIATLKLSASNNALSIIVGGITNDRNAMIQVGHADYGQYGNNLGNLYLNKLGGDVYIGGTLAATINSNVASATKLQTKRSLWGNDFDGTGSINGSLYLANHGIHLAVTSALGWNQTYILSTGWTQETGDFTDIHVPSSGANDARLRLLRNGNVGIGTTSPSTKLTVKHTDNTIGIRLDGGWSGYGYRYTAYALAIDGVDKANFGYNTVTSSYNTTSQCGTYIFNIASNEWMNFNNEGGVYLHANFLVKGGITQYSDIRKKTKLQDVELSLKQVANAPLIEHYYNSDDKKTTHVGSIAQYWAEMNDWFCKLDSDGYYTMEIQNAALASAISVARELERYESKTDKKIRMLKKRINELEDEIEKLKK